ncbi:MAG: nucleoside deaminase [Desulfobulbaceae bacterium]|nr:nucleoside deaminase [Desulfobulbaceae bacterium]
MHKALAEARRALAGGEFPVGCIIVYEDRVVARGRRSNSRGLAANEMDHAEISALRRLLTDHPDIAPKDVTVYATMEPCLMCFTTMLLNGIRRIVYAYEDIMGGGTDLDLSSLKPLYQQIAMEITPQVCRAESLELFREFFNNPNNDYWQESLLTQYTLRQS